MATVPPLGKAILNKVITGASVAWVAAILANGLLLGGSLNGALTITFFALAVPALVVQGLRGNLRPGGDGGGDGGGGCDGGH